MDFFSVLIDGSQARKAKSEKEIVLVRTERNGIPVYIAASLPEMERFGGGNADSIVNGTGTPKQLVLTRCQLKIIAKNC